MALKILAEALGRLEHKADIIIHLLRDISKFVGSSFRIPAVGEFGHNCPVCGQQVNYEIDARAEVLNRKCGCKSGKIAPIRFEPIPIPPKRSSNVRRSEDDE